MNRPDPSLLVGCVAGEASAQQAFVDRFRPVVSRAVERTLRRFGLGALRADREDIVQEVFASLWADGCRALRAAPADWTLAAWISMIAARRCLDFARQQTRAVFRALPLPPDLPAPAVPDPDPDAGEESRRLRSALAALPPRERLAIRLFTFEGRSYREIAALLRVPVGTVGTILARARKRLADALWDITRFPLRS
ncbi:MAG: sigma-70 family RNA polymerase sigma factor [Planctomycetes bacterium]|nr:sigma-70 family RNA polymerase sigma factor [Planctomycetota bacterium]